MRDAYETTYANVHRGVHCAEPAGDRALRGRPRRRSRASSMLASVDEIVFMRGATEAINLVAASLGQRYLSAGDEVVISHMEHHSNIVPWQMLRDAHGIVLKVVPIDDDGEPRLRRLRAPCSAPRTKLVAVTHVSNALGTVNPVAEIVGDAHAAGALVLIDGSQAVPHHPVDVQALDADFYVLLRPQALRPDRHRRALRQGASCSTDMPPYQGGGEMIASVTFDETRLQEAAAPLRGRHAADRRGDRAWRRHRLPERASGLRTHRRPRARAARLRDARLERDPGPAHHRHRAGKGGDRFVRHGWRASARHRHHPRSGRGRRPRRTSLRAAGDGALRRAGDGARVVRALQHRRRGRRPGRRPCKWYGRFSADDRPARALSGGDPRSRPPAAQLPADRTIRELPGPRPQPDVRRYADGVPDARRDEASPTWPSRARAAPSRWPRPR